MKVYLEVMKGVQQGRQITLPAEAEFVIGRSVECHLRPASAAVSKRHCILKVEGGRVSVRDLGSGNGTRVNAARVEGDDFELRRGDLLEVGPLAFLVRMEGQPVETSPDEDALATLLLDLPGGEPDRAVDTVVDALATDNQTLVDLPAQRSGLAAPYRPGKSGQDKKPVDTAEAARALLEQYRTRRRVKKE